MTEGTPLTADQRARVLELDKAGRSASQIATTLYEEFSVVKTRNAIIGVLNRAGARKARGSRGNETRKAKTASTNPESRYGNRKVGGRALRPVPVAAPAEVADAPAGSVGLLDLAYGQCRTVVGRGEDLLAAYCGAPVRAGTSWCPRCAARHFQPMRAEAVE